MLFNQSRAIEYLRHYRLDALVATSTTNVTYFSDYYSWIDRLFTEHMVSPGASSNHLQSYAVFPLAGEPALVVSPSLAVNASDVWIHDLYTFGNNGLDTSLPPNELTGRYRQLFDLLKTSQDNNSAVEALLAVLTDRGLTEGRIGVEMEGVNPVAKALITEALPRAELKDATNLIRLIRMVKSPEEIARLTRAAEISEIAGMESLAMARPGQSILELARRYRARIAEMGAELDHFAYSIYGMGIATEADYTLSKDEVLFVDFGCIYRYYFSDTGTTLAFRRPSETLLARFAALRQCMAAGIDRIRPGVRASAVQAVMQETLVERGITTSFPHGHGVGIEVRDYPIIVPDNGLRIHDGCVDVASDLPLEKDMVINLEAAIFMSAVGALHTEQSFVVTETGCRPLIDQSRSEPFIPGVQA